MYNLDLDANPSRAMSFVFKSKNVILFLTGSKHINSRHTSTSYAGFLAGVEDCMRLGGRSLAGARPHRPHRRRRNLLGWASWPPNCRKLMKISAACVRPLFHRTLTPSITTDIRGRI